MRSNAATPRVPRRLRWREFGALLAAVLLVHALLLGLLPGGTGARVVRSVSVRQIVLPPSPVSPPAAQAKADSARPAAVVVAKKTQAPVAARPVAAAAPVAQPVAAGPIVTPPPVYPTRLPPPARLRYEQRRGAQVGSAELVWRPGDDSYTLTLEGSTIAGGAAGWASAGGFDAAGIAPERFVDRRRGRDVRAANFRRDSGRITYSGPQVEHPLLPGAQDRLSWMLQLPAIVEADPERFTAGAQVTMLVTGTRGDAEAWTFVVEAVEPVDLPEGRIDNALRLHREPTRAYDAAVEVWLDPARAHLPVRLRLSVAQTGDATEFRLSELAAP